MGKEEILYRRWFSEYIVKKLELEKYDEKIERSNLNFRRNTEDKMDIYQYFMKERLKYFYIRNNLYEDRLSKEEKEFLKQRTDEKKYNLDKQAEEFIEKTYKKVIFEDILNNGEKCEVPYGPTSSGFFAPNDAVVIGLNYDEFYREGLDGKTWKEQNLKQREFLRNLIKQMEQKFMRKLDSDVRIIKYNKFSIEKRNLLQERDNDGR